MMLESSRKEERMRKEGGKMLGEDGEERNDAEEKGI